MTELIDDIQQINNLAEEFSRAANVEHVSTEQPPSLLVKLPGGFLFDDGTVSNEAEVKELNGFDEEAIAKATSPAKAMEVTLQRGLTSIGGKPAKGLNLDNLLLGDRDAILLGIRVATFGETIGFDQLCGSCNEVKSFTANLTTGLETVELKDPAEDRVLSIEISKGTLKLVLPNLVTGRRLEQVVNKSFAEFTTELLAGCIVSLNDSHVIGRDLALELGMKDRQQIVDSLLNAAPGPRLTEVRSTCEACGVELNLSLSLADMFRV